eukprot:g15303.t1
MTNAPSPEGRAFGDVDIVFTDLDGTFYPGAHETDETSKPMFRRNLRLAEILETECAVPVVPATGNNVGIAQVKFTGGAPGKKENDVCSSPKKINGSTVLLRDLRASPGIYCNGALVLGEGGRVISSQSVCGEFVKKMEAAFGGGGDSFEASVCSGCCLVGLGAEVCWVLEGDGPDGESSRRTADAFLRRMGLMDDRGAILSFGGKNNPPAGYLRTLGGCDVLSLVILFPDGASDEVRKRRQLAAQRFLEGKQLLRFGDGVAAGQLANGVGEKVVCKHVHVPGIGPEIDISPTGVNKGTAVTKYLAWRRSDVASRKPHSRPESPKAATGSRQEGLGIAVFGDAGNDLELFGVKRAGSGAGQALVPLFGGGGVEEAEGAEVEEKNFRPIIRAAMPWANDALLLQDANIVDTVDKVLERIIDAKKARKRIN